MSEPKMTAEERIAKHTIRVAVQYCEDEEFVEPEDAVEACKAHASEAVEPWKARVAELERERDAAQARVAEMEAKSHTYCAYCGHKEEIDPDGTAIAQHIAQCKKHPMRRVERERDTAREIVEKMEAERYVTLQRLDELVRERDEARGERDFQRERAQVNVDQREEAWARVAELERKRSRALGALTNVQRQLSQAEARVAELERERDAARALSNSLLLDIGQIAEAIESKASEPSALLADAQALKARVAELEAERDEARFQAEYYADGLESLADDLPEWQHQHADGETEDQSIIERAITTVVEWRSEKAKRVKAAARIAELEREVEALREALTPSGATKAAYSGEVKTHGAHWDDYVSWSAIKDVMTLIRERAAAALGKEDDRG